MATGSGIAGPWAAITPVNPAQTVLLRFVAGTTPKQQQATLDAVGGRVVSTFENGPSVVALAPWEDRAVALATLQRAPSLVYAQADSTFHVAAITPNDTYYSSQWGPAMIEAPQAWSITTGTPSTIVAILDTGIDLRNTEFTSHLWVNASASTSRKTAYGWNFVSNNSNTQDNNGHGTHVAGVLAATGNNSYGVAGVNWKATIMPLKVLDGSGDGSTDTAVSAIYFAVNNGAKVINASWGGDVFSQAMLDALNFANTRNVVFVTAAGNESSSNDAITSYPASYRTPNELVVAAIDRFGKLADYSNYGVSSVDLAAPGTDIYSTIPGSFASYSGTSMATPFVSGTVALLAGLQPNLTAAQLVNVVRATARPLPSLSGVTISGGVVDAYRALTGLTTGGGTVSISGSPQLVANGTSLSKIEGWIATSDAIYNALGATPRAFVNLSYNTLLGRAPTSDELNSGAALLNSGSTRYSVYQSIQSTSEALQTRVARWYLDLVGWQTTLDVAKASGAIAFWASSLASGSTDGQVISAILGSEGYYQAVGGTNPAFVNAIFRALLGRDAEASAVSYFNAQLEGGMTRVNLVHAILSVPEARRIIVAHLYQDEYGWTTPLSQLKTNSAVVYLGNQLKLG